MMAIHLKRTLLTEAVADIIISDHIAQAGRLYPNIQKCNLFSNVYFFEEFDISNQLRFSNKLTRYFYIINRKRYINRALLLSDKYDLFFATDASETISWIYEVLLDKNAGLQLYYFEEGPVSVLCDHGNQFLESPYYYKGKKRRVINKLLNLTQIQGNYSGAYISVKNQMANTYFPLFDIPQFNPNELLDYVRTLNNIWEYHEDDTFADKVIFFEESFSVDGIPCTDEKIVTDLVEFWGIEKVVVKLHPRTRINRFERLGISTNQNSDVPWELIALNGKMENSLLICISSGSIIHPQLYWGIIQESICLADCEEYKFEYLQREYYQTFINLCKEKKHVKIPRNKETFYEMMTSYKMEKVYE